jgi:DNA-binding transcriptional LysR family regulator
MNSGLSWDEFRLVKSVAEARSLVGAAELLGVNHSTVFRRLAAVEAAVGARLFERARSGYEPTAAGEEMIALATTMAESVQEFERRVAGRDVKPTGELTVTTPEAIGQHFMPTIVAQFQTQNPGVVVELILSDQPLNLSRRDADIAIRMTNDPPETLVGRRICTGRWGVYCRRPAGGLRPTYLRGDWSRKPTRRIACSSWRFRALGRRCCPASLAIAARTWCASVIFCRNSTLAYGC